MSWILESHLIASEKITASSIALLDLLPETDIVLEVKTLLELQDQILISTLNKKNFGQKKLEFIEDHCSFALSEAERIKNGKGLH